MDKIELKKIFQKALSGFDINAGLFNTVEGDDMFEQKVGEQLIKYMKNHMSEDDIKKLESSLDMSEDENGPIVK